MNFLLRAVPIPSEQDKEHQRRSATQLQLAEGKSKIPESHFLPVYHLER
jgi:hypothetical protein